MPGADPYTVVTVTQWSSKAEYDKYEASRIYRATADRPGITALINDVKSDISPALKFSDEKNMAHYSQDTHGADSAAENGA